MFWKARKQNILLCRLKYINTYIRLLPQMTDSIQLSKLQQMAIQERNNEGFQQLKSQLLGFITNRIPDREEAEDLLHDVYIQMDVTVEPIEQLRAWLYRVTRNRIIDRFRKKKADAFSSLNEHDQQFEQSAKSNLASPDNELMDKLVLQEIRRKIN